MKTENWVNAKRAMAFWNEKDANYEALKHKDSSSLLHFSDDFAAYIIIRGDLVLAKDGKFSNKQILKNLKEIEIM